MSLDGFIAAPKAAQEPVGRWRLCRSAARAGWLLVGGVLQRGDVDLLHREHGGHDSPRLVRIGIREQLRKNGGDDFASQARTFLPPTPPLPFAALPRIR